jgi:hypothetical protein
MSKYNASVVRSILKRQSEPCNNRLCRPFGGLLKAGVLFLAAGMPLWWQTASAADEEPAMLRQLVERLSMTGERRMMRGVCDQGPIEVRNGVLSCAVCPSYTSSAGDKTGFTISEAIPGSFVAEREQEVLLNMEGCEPQSDLAGGMVLLRNTSSGWSRLQYQKGYRLRDCLKFRTVDKTHALLCNQSTFAQGSEIGEILWVSVTANDLQVKPLLRWYDNLNSNPRQLVTVFPARFQRSDFNQDGRSDVRILFRLREETIPEKYPGAVDAIDAGYEPAKPRLLGLIYLFDGKSLSLHKASQKDFDEIRTLLEKYVPAGKP